MQQADLGGIQGRIGSDQRIYGKISNKGGPKVVDYTETMTALDAIDDGTLSDEKAVYYAEVTLRINQKLLEIA